MTAFQAQLPETDLRRRVHAGCFVCDQDNPVGLRLRFASQPDGSVCTEFRCPATSAGYRGIVHGGILAAILDGAMTNCLLAAGRACLTADLRVRYRLPVRLSSTATVRARVERESPPLFVLGAEIVQDGQVKVRATGKFLEAGPKGVES